MKAKLSQIILGFIVLGVATAKSAQVDLGITIGTVLGTSGIITDARVELGTFSSYSDASGLAYFTGKDYTTLRSAFTSLVYLDSPETTGSTGQYYGSFDTASTASGTRLFAWIFSGPTASASSNWAVVSGGGTGPNSSTYNPVWLAVAPTAIDVNIIEAGTIYTQIFASTAGASIVPSTAFDAEGADISLVPEPSTGALMMIGAAGLVALRRLRKV